LLKSVKSQLWWYLAVEFGLLFAAIATRGQVRGLLCLIIVIIGTVTFTVNVIRRRPEPPVAWWLALAGVWIMVAEALAVAVSYGLAEAFTVTALAPVLLSTLPYPVLAAALAALSRVTARRGPVDALDAALIALSGYLLLWVFLINDQFVLTTNILTVAVVLPVGALLMFAMAVRVVLGGGWRDAATALLILVVIIMLTVSLVSVRLGIGSDAIRIASPTLLLWSTFGVTVGAIGLLPSFTRRRRQDETATHDLSVPRLVLYTVLALGPVIGWVRDTLNRLPNAVAARAIPMSVAVLFLAILAVRLTLLARLAQRRADQLEFQATHDSLTHLANRVLLTDELTSRRRREHCPDGALVMLDLDGFKEVNDEHGHPVGDEVLVQVARRLATAVPPTAQFVRLGGDEFAVLVEGVDGIRAARIAQQILSAVNQPCQVDGLNLRVTASVGVVTIERGRAPGATEAIRAVDAALYEAKAAGRNRAVLHELDGHPPER
jgi:diguanylate cyclase (GGDEF)-like protein